MLALRPLPVLLIFLAALLSLAPAASADAIPGMGVAWPRCVSTGETTTDTDNRYCVQAELRNGTPIVEPMAGHWFSPYVDLIGAGDVRFGVTDEDASGVDPSSGDVDPSDSYKLVVRTGAIHPRELWGRIQDADYDIWGSSGNWGFTLSFRPVPAAWYWGPLGDNPSACSVDPNPCDDASTVATLVYNGFVTGYVTDLASSGLPHREIPYRAGFVHVYNAQDASEAHYDVVTNSLVIDMMNPHLRAPGLVATGSYETFIPNAMLINVLEVPDPASLTAGSFTVRRTVGGTTTSTPFTLTHEPGGIRIVLSGLTFSSPKIHIKPRASAPGRPRSLSGRRLSATTARLRFREPFADGGKAITRYAARCTAAHHATRRVYKAHGPIVVRNLDAGVRYSCRVRAYNAIGAGRWTAAIRLARRP